MIVKQVTSQDVIEHPELFSMSDTEVFLVENAETSRVSVITLPAQKDVISFKICGVWKNFELGKEGILEITEEVIKNANAGTVSDMKLIITDIKVPKSVIEHNMVLTYVTS